MDPVVILANDTVSAGPGGEARLQVRVRNQGRRVESYAIEVVGAPARFAVVEPANVSVLPGKEAEVSITFRPPVGASTPTGTLPFAVRAVSEVGSSSSAVAEGRLELSGAAGLQAWADATTDAGRWSGSYRLSFLNQGNAPARLFISAHDPSGTMRLTVRDEVLAVPPGAQVDTEIAARARQPFLRGSAVNRIITASCQDFPFGAERPVPGQAPPREDPNHRTFQLTFQQKPIVSKVVLALGALLIAGVVAFALLRLRGGEEVALGLARPNPPSAVTAEASGSNAIFLQWERVPNAAGYDIRRTTDAGEASGPAVEHVDSSTLTFTVEGLDPGEQQCFAIEATGPEGVDNSPRSDFACATTTPPPTLAAPTNFQATEVSAGTFDVQWEAPSTEGLTFTLYSNNEPLQEGIAGLFAKGVQVPRRELSFPAELKVRAVAGDQTSDFSNAVTVTIAALPVTGDTTGAPTTAGPGGPGGTPTTAPGGGGGTPTTTPGGGATTTTAVTTTTAPSTPAQDAVEDRPASWVAMLGPVQPVPVGPGEASQRTTLGQAFGVAPEQLQKFTNRDTVARDARNAPIASVTSAGPEDEFFFVPHANEAAASGFCHGDIRCQPMILQGAPSAAEGTNVLVLDSLDPTTPLADLDEALTTMRTDSARPQIHVLDGQVRDQFDVPELLVFASGFADEQAVRDFCVATGVERCTPVVLAPQR